MAPENLDAERVSLFLDVDGTLLEICDDPSDVRADEQLVEILDACFARLDGAMSLVSGRSIAEIDRIFAPSVFPVAGEHGTELRLTADGPASAVTGSLPEGVFRLLDEFAKQKDGLLLERKRGGVSLHYRKAPHLETECRNIVTAALTELGDEFRLISGKMVLEIAPSANDKGAAIRRFVTHAPFAGRTPVFIGDDVTDEDGFREVNSLAGISIRVGEKRESMAVFHLPDVASVHSWLRATLLDKNDKKIGENVF